MSVEPRRDSKRLTALVSGLSIHPHVTVILPAATHRLTLAASFSPQRSGTSRSNGAGGQVLFRELFSLREPEVYGPCVYRGTIGSGIQGGRLADYRIALAVVTREMIAAELQRCGASRTGCWRSFGTRSYPSIGS